MTDKRIKKFRDNADTLTKRINELENPASAEQRPTQRRMGIIQGMYKEARKLREQQAALRGVADAIENETLPNVLSDITMKKQIIALLSYKYPGWDEGLVKALSKAGIIGTNFEFAKSALQALTQTEPIDTTKQKIAELEHKVIDMHRNDFFATPPELGKRLMAITDVYPGASVLEPSAGNGQLAQAIMDYQPACELTVIEIN